MIEMVIWLVVIAAFVFRALKQNGTLDELFAGAKKRKKIQDVQIPQHVYGCRGAKEGACGTE